MMGNGVGGAWMWLFGLLILAGLAVIVLVLVMVLGGGISRPGPTTDGSAPGQSARSRAREILDDRYARGEVTTEEYRERLQTLDGG